MGHKKNRKYSIRPQNNFQQSPVKKSMLSTGMRVLIGLALIVIVVVALSVSLSQTTPSGQQQQSGNQGQSYPQNVAPVVYTTPTLTSNDAKVTVPANFVNSSKLVFVDLKLQTPTETLPYNGRTVPLAYYKNGDYLPLVIISTPSGNTVAGIRTCEPCGSFSFHIVKGTNLKCDVCGAEWTLEDFAPASGGCATYPPPKLTTTTIGNNVEIDLSPLQIQFA